MLEYVITCLSKDLIDFPAIETADPNATTRGKFKKELSRYTPLMLSIDDDKDNFECFKTLLKNGANINCKDEFENTILHIAAMYDNNQVLNYICKNLKINLFQRNKSEETALIICNKLKNAEGAKMIEEYLKEYDHS